MILLPNSKRSVCAGRNARKALLLELNARNGAQSNLMLCARSNVTTARLLSGDLPLQMTVIRELEFECEII